MLLSGNAASEFQAQRHPGPVPRLRLVRIVSLRFPPSVGFFLLFLPFLFLPSPLPFHRDGKGDPNRSSSVLQPAGGKCRLHSRDRPVSHAPGRADSAGPEPETPRCRPRFAVVAGGPEMRAWASRPRNCPAAAGAQHRCHGARPGGAAALPSPGRAPPCPSVPWGPGALLCFPGDQAWGRAPPTSPCVAGPGARFPGARWPRSSASGPGPPAHVAVPRPRPRCPGPAHLPTPPSPAQCASGPLCSARCARCRQPLLVFPPG